MSDQQNTQAKKAAIQYRLDRLDGSITDLQIRVAKRQLNDDESYQRAQNTIANLITQRHELAEDFKAL